MGNVKFGINQVSSPAPIGWRRFERAYLILLVPALAALVHGWGFESDVLVKRLDLLIIFSASLVKAFGMFLGNGQEYADKPIDPQTSGH